MDEKTMSFKRQSSDTFLVDYAAELFRTRVAADISIICDSLHFRCHKVMLIRRDAAARTDQSPRGQAN